MKRLTSIFVLLFPFLVHGQTSSQRVVFTSANPPTVCAPGKLYTNKTTSKVYLGSSVGGCTDVTGGAAGIGGSTGATDNAILRASGTGGATLQSSLSEMGDDGAIKINNGTQSGVISATSTAFGNHLRVNDGTTTNTGIEANTLILGGASSASGNATLVYDAGNIKGVMGDVGIWGFANVTIGGAVALRDALDTAISRNGAGVLEVNSGTRGTLRDITFRNFKGSGTGAAQFRTTQTTAPTCTTNCGTGSPTVSGTDTFMTVNLGTTPASGFVVVFNGTWAAAPSCVAQMATAGMVVGKQPLTVVTTTGQLTVVTNGTAPSTGDKYHIHCGGLN
jgi:hypothetical protein